jgi:metallo-beta-lactamase family protein
MTMTTLSFLGAVGTVTGSRFLLTHRGRRVLIDAGLFQGYKQIRQRNWQPLPVDPRLLDAVVLTHAHLDHSGYVPRLARQGFRGPVYATGATCDLCDLLWSDSGHLQEEDAAYANRHGFSKHKPAEPLYSVRDAELALPLLRATAWHEEFEPVAGMRVQFRRAGHLLGAASVSIELHGSKPLRLLFSGDVGRPHDLLMKPPEPPCESDVLVIESTYGDRAHADIDCFAELAELLMRVISRSGVAVVPVFAVGRAQLLLHLIATLKQSGALPAQLPVFLDSPMAIDATTLYTRHHNEHRLTPEQCKALARTAKWLRTPEDSKSLAKLHGPMVILSASGMATGGRVLHHLKLYLPSPRNMVLLTGYQAPGTRGASLQDAAPSVRIHGEDIAVKAEVVSLQSLSAHADSHELLAWVRQCPKLPARSFIVHGEPAAADAMRQRLERELKINVEMPEQGEVVPL